MSRKDSQKNSRAQANLVSEAKAWHPMRWPCGEMGIDAAFGMVELVWGHKKKLNWQRFTGVLLKDHLEETY